MAVKVCTPCRKKLKDAGWGSRNDRRVCDYCGNETDCTTVHGAIPLPTAQPPLTPNTPLV